jgi:L-malate glycosyltransferase
MNRPRRLLMITALPQVGPGIRSATEELAERLASSGIEVRLVSRQQRRVPRLLEMLVSILRWRRWYDVVEISVFSGAAFIWAEACCALLKTLRRPYVLTLRGGGLPAFIVGRERRVRRILRAAAAVNAPSPFLAEAVKSMRTDVRVLLGAIDTDVFSPSAQRPHGPTIVWARAFHDIYRPQICPAIIDRVRQAYPDVRLFMIGPDKGDGTLEETRRAVAVHGVADEVQIVGPVAHDEIAGWYGRASIFLNTTRTDNAPVSLLKAMAAGLVVVTSDAGGIGRLVTDHEDGIIVPVEDVEAFADAVTTILDDADLGARLAVRARERVLASSWSEVLPQWIDMLEPVFAIAGGVTEGPALLGAQQGLRYETHVRPGPVLLRRLAELHASAFPHGRTSLLGQGFLRGMYRWFATDPASCLIVATSGGRLMGAAAGTVGGYGRRMFRANIGRVILGGLRHPVRLIHARAFRASRSYLRSLAPWGLGSPGGGPTDPIVDSGGTRASLATIAVAGTARGQGVGRGLLAAFEREMFDRGVGELTLTVDGDNEAAARMYGSAGWQNTVVGSDASGVSLRFVRKREP